VVIDISKYSAIVKRCHGEDILELNYMENAITLNFFRYRIKTPAMA
jgi:hypothetical protein